MLDGRNRNHGIVKEDDKLISKWKVLFVFSQFRNIHLT